MVKIDFCYDSDGSVKIRFDHEKGDGVMKMIDKIRPELKEELKGTGTVLKGFEVQNPLVTFADRYNRDYYKDLSDERCQNDAWICDTLGEFWKDSPDDPGKPKQSVMKVLTRVLEVYLKEHEELLELREK